jgi:hypothetical protein
VASGSDASTLARQCHTIWGNLEITSSTSGDVTLNGVKNITGNLGPANDYDIATNTQLTNLESQSLEQIGLWLDIPPASHLQTIRLPHLQSIGTGINLVSLPSLKAIDLSGLQSVGQQFLLVNASRLESLAIPRNVASDDSLAISITGTNLESLNSFAVKVQNLDLSYNPRLSQVTVYLSETQGAWFPNGTALVDGHISLYNNAHSVSVSFPDLVSTVGYIELWACSHIFVPSLSVVGGGLYLRDATFASFAAPNLKTVNGTVNITGAFSG